MDWIQAFLEWALSFIEVWGYLGLFIVELIGSATIIFPAPTFLINFILGGLPGFNPWLVGIAAGTGSAIGQLTGYALGRGGREVIDKKYKPMLDKTKKWMKSHGDFFIIFIFAATPLPHDIVGIISGAVNYDIKKFFIATLAGKILAGIIIAWAGFYSINFILDIFQYQLPTSP